MNKSAPSLSPFAGLEQWTAAHAQTYDGIVNVKDFGAVGDGIADDTSAIQSAINEAFGTVANPHGAARYHLNRQLIFPPGHYIANNLALAKLQGARVLGAGRFTTTVEARAANASPFAINGAGYCRFEGLHLKSNGTGTCFDLDYDNSGGGAALQSNTFLDMFFEGGAYGVRIAVGGYMGSENSFVNCFWISQTVAGLATMAGNALQNQVFGGNFQSCQRGIWIANGSVPIIHGVGFQQSVECDIHAIDTSTDTHGMHIAGCRSESQHFAKTSIPSAFVACSQSSSVDGDFLYQNGNLATIDTCVSTRGRVVPRSWAMLSVRNSQFFRSDWLAPDQLWWVPNNTQPANIEIDNVLSPSGLIRRQRISTPNGRDLVRENYVMESA